MNKESESPLKWESDREKRGQVSLAIGRRQGRYATDNPVIFLFSQENKSTIRKLDHPLQGVRAWKLFWLKES